MTAQYLEILHINGQASIQDLGRLNAQHLGFSAGGAADEFAFLTANKLISDYMAACVVDDNDNNNNSDHQHAAWAAIEITLGQISFRASSRCIIAITGADCAVKINDVLVKNWQCHPLKVGDIIDFSLPKSALHSYIAISGGFTCQPGQLPWLGSFSQTKNEMALGFTGESLKAHSKLYFTAARAHLTQVQTEYETECETGSETTYSAENTATQAARAPNQPTSNPTLFYAQKKLTLRIMVSSLFNNMSFTAQQRFLATEYIISPDSNRMGYRLKAEHSQLLPSNEKILTDSLRHSCLLSMPVTYGMVQFPANEQPIVLMKERQTMGGYPVLGTVMQTDLFRLSQMRPGEKVNFSVISHQQAQQQLFAFQQRF